MGRYANLLFFAVLAAALLPVSAFTQPGSLADGMPCSFSSDCTLGFLCAQKINGGDPVCLDPRTNALKQEEKVHHYYEESLGIEVTRSIYIVPLRRPGTGAGAVTFIGLSLRNVGPRKVDVSLSDKMPAGMTPEQARQTLFNPRPLGVEQSDGRYYARWRFNVSVAEPVQVNYTLPFPVSEDAMSVYPLPLLSETHDDPSPLTGLLSTVSASPVMAAVILVIGLLGFLFAFAGSPVPGNDESLVTIHKLKQVLWKHPKENTAHARRLKDV